MKFKLWLQIQENLSGPGGGPDSEPESQVNLAKNIASKGAGAFQSVSCRPHKKILTPASKYEDPRFCKDK